MKERLKLLRKNLGLTQSDFGNVINITGATISDIEKGKRNLTDRNIALICEKYKVNENWLRTGQGEMFVETNEDIIEDVANEYNLSEIDKEIVRLFVELPSEKRAAVKDFAFGIFNVIENNSELNDEYKGFKNHMTSNSKNISKNYSEEYASDMNIEKELESYRRELEYEKDSKMSSASQPLDGKKHA